ncbi:MAG TPA: hypothetical protein VIY86_01320, partial [Pirellulaceae bacterium]
MSTGTTSPAPSTGSNRAIETLGYQEFVDRQVGKVSSLVRASDLAGAFLSWAFWVTAGTLGFVLIDHWWFDPGHWGRFAALVVLSLVTLWYVGRRIVPLALHRINPAYSAKVIEESQSGLRGALLNLVFLRQRPNGAPETVLKELEQQTATQLSRMSVDDVVDRTEVVRWLAAVATIVVLFTGYAVFSAKDVFPTVQRILAPWSRIARPSRVRITAVQPGDTQVYFGGLLHVSAEVQRLADNDSVELVFTTEDRRSVDQRVPMRRAANTDEFAAKLPSETSGLESELEYRIEAGDAVAGPFRVRVLPAPSIVVDRIQYDFPSYTGQASQTVKGDGDIEAVEGTMATIFGRANQDIRAAAFWFNAGAAERPSPGTSPTSATVRQPLRIDGRLAEGHFTLMLHEDRTTPTYSNYEIRFENLDGESNPDPVRHQIRVIRDLGPMIEILSPSSR